MQPSNLQPFLEQLSFKLPLEVDLENISAWLQTLDLEDAGQACGRMLRLLKALKTEGLEADVEFKILAAVRSTLEQAASKQEKYLLDIGSPFPEAPQTTVELLTFCYAELAMRFWHVADDASFSQDSTEARQNAAGALYQALEALRRSLFYVALLYDRPYEGFWRLCYRIYRRAELLGVLELGINGDSTGNVCIGNSFKNLLVFYVSDTTLLTQREMKALFNLFNNRPVVVKIYNELREDKVDLLFGFAVNHDLPPVPARHMGSLDGELRYFATVKLAKAVCEYLKGERQKQDSLDTGNYSLFLKIGKTLAMQESRKHNRVKENRSCPALIGFKDVLKFLLRKNAKALVQELQSLAPQEATDASSASGGWDNSELSLVPIGEEDVHRLKTAKSPALSGKQRLKMLFDDLEAIISTPDSGAKKGGQQSAAAASETIESLSILDSSMKDYTARLGSKTPVKVGELLGLLSGQDNRVELGLVRRISRVGQQDVELGVELAALETDVALILRADQARNAQPVIFVPSIAALKQPDTIMYPSHAFSIGETVFMQHSGCEILCRIHKLLHATTTFSYAELIVEQQ